MKRALVLLGLPVMLGGCSTSQTTTEQSAQPIQDRGSPGDLRSDATSGDQEFSKRMWGPEDGADPRVYGELAGFLLAAGGAAVVVDFDDEDLGDLGGRVLMGVTFLPGPAPLEVVRADQTRTTEGYEDLAHPELHRLHATSGACILSPGGVRLAPGPSPDIEDDDITLVFDPPVASFSFDLLTPSADGMSFTDVTIISTDGSTLHAGRVQMPRLSGGSSAYPPPGAGFFGFVADARVIREVRIDETDGDAACPDSNIAIDTIRFAPAPVWQHADMDLNGVLDHYDTREILQQIEAWEADPGPADRWWTADLNRDHRVDSSDLMILGSFMGAVGG